MLSALIIENSSEVTPHLVRLLGEVGAEVRLVSDSECEVAGLRPLVADLTDTEALAAAMEGVGVVFNLVDYRCFGRRGRELMWRLSLGEVRAACAAALRCGVQTFVYLSSVETIGHPTSHLLANASSSFLPDAHRTSYGHCKFRQEAEVLQAVEGGLRAAMVCVGEMGRVSLPGGLRGWLARRLGYAPCGVRPVSEPVDVAAEMLRLAQSGESGKSLCVSRNEKVGSLMLGRERYVGVGRMVARLLCGMSADEAAYWTAVQRVETRGHGDAEPGS